MSSTDEGPSKVRKRALDDSDMIEPPSKFQKLDTMKVSKTSVTAEVPGNIQKPDTMEVLESIGAVAKGDEFDTTAASEPIEPSSKVGEDDVKYESDSELFIPEGLGLLDELKKEKEEKLKAKEARKEKYSRPPGEPRVKDPAYPNLDEIIDEVVAKINEVPDPATMSKSQLKRLRREQAWEAQKDNRRLKRREKHKAKQARKAEARAELAAKVANGEYEAVPPASKDKKERKRPARPIQLPVGLILDCDFNELMTEKEIISLGAQLTRCYSDNRTAPYRSHFAVSSWGGVLKERFEDKLAGQFRSWKGVKFFEEDFEGAAEELNKAMRGPGGGKLVAAFAKKEDEAPAKEAENNGESTATGTANDPVIIEDSNSMDLDVPDLGSKAVPEDNRISTPYQVIEPTVKEKPAAKDEPSAESDSAEPLPPPQIVYLTSDSDHTLTELSPNTSYIIGGIVDKNRHKGICHKRATQRGIQTARLPIGEFMIMQSRSVLAINHVVEIMLNWLETGDWGEAFMAVIPKRKEAKLRRQATGEEEAQDAEVGESGDGDDDGSVDREEGSEDREEHSEEPEMESEEKDLLDGEPSINPISIAEDVN